MVMRITERERLTILNKNRRHTWRRKQKTATLDLAWVSRGEENKCGWGISKQDTGSDHALIKVKYNMKGDQVRELRDKNPYRKADWNKVREQLRGEMWRSEEQWKKARENEDDKAMARIMREGLNKAICEGVPKTRTTWRSKAWFDEEVKEKRRKLAEAGRWKRGKRWCWREGTEKAWKENRTEYFQTIRRKKKEKWDEYIEEASSNEAVW